MKIVCCLESKSLFLFSVHYIAYSNKTNKLLNEQETSGLLGSLGLKTTLSRIPFCGDYFNKYKIKNIVYRFSFVIVGDKFMPEIHLTQPGFTYRAYGSFAKKTKYQYKA